MHGYGMPTQGGDRLLRGYPQGQEAARRSGHGGRLRAASRGAAVRSPGAGAPAQEAGAVARWCSRCSASARVWSTACCRRRSAPRTRCCPSATTTPALRSRSAEHALELCNWTDALFERPGPKETEEERRLRHAACLLSDIGWRAHPDYRGEQSLILIAHCGAGRHRSSGPGVPGADHLLPPCRFGQRAEDDEGQGLPSG